MIDGLLMIDIYNLYTAYGDVVFLPISCHFSYFSESAVFGILFYYTNHAGGLYKALKQYRMLLQYTVILIISVV